MAPPEAGPLGPAAIQKAMAEALPAQDDSPAIKSPYEAIALAVHAYLALLDFRLVGFDESRFLRMLPLLPLYTHHPHPVTSPYKFHTKKANSPQRNASPSPLASHPHGTRDQNPYRSSTSTSSRP